MVVDIYIREKNGSREIRIPWLPDNIGFKSGGTIRASYDIMDRGPVEIPTGSGLKEYSWESTFPGKNRTDTSMLRGEWKDPKVYHEILEDWKAKGTLLTILVTGYPINTDVYLDDYNGEATGAFGDIDYDISLIEARDITITSTKVPEPVRPTATGQKYTIKSGDTLWSIAKRFLGSGTKWKTIYDANKEIIESTAKARWKAAGINRDSQNGHWIFPGTVITIPGAGGGSGGTATPAAKTHSLFILNGGMSAYFGIYNLYVNGTNVWGGNAQNLKKEIKEGAKVRISARATDGHKLSMEAKRTVSREVIGVNVKQITRYEVIETEFTMTEATSIRMNWSK